jgi:CBS-domain-containing membrane protein
MMNLDKKPFRLIDDKFLKNPRYYLIQTAVAIVAVAVLLYFVTYLTHAAIVAALGSSTFIVFAMPRYVSAQPRRLIGGHIIGIVCGLAGYYLFTIRPLAVLTGQWYWIPVAAAALSIGLSILLMPVFNAEHPPAAGTALGIAFSGWESKTILFVLLFAIGLAVIRKLLLKYLRDLV